MSRRYIVEHSRRRVVEVYADSIQQACDSVFDMYTSGDACAELLDPECEVIYEWEDGE